MIRRGGRGNGTAKIAAHHHLGAAPIYYGGPQTWKGLNNWTAEPFNLPYNSTFDRVFLCYPHLLSSLSVS